MLFNFIWHLQVIFASKHSTLIPWVHIEFNNMNFHSEERIIYVWQKPSSWRINSYQIPKGNKFSLFLSCQLSSIQFALSNSVCFTRFRNESTGNSLAHPCPSIANPNMYRWPTATEVEKTYQHINFKYFHIKNSQNGAPG